MHLNAVLWRPDESLKSTREGFTGGCESSNLGTWNRILVLAEDALNHSSHMNGPTSTQAEDFILV